MSSSKRFIPPGFRQLVWVCALLLAAALVHESVRDRSFALARPRTSLRQTRIAYASWNRIAAP